MKLGIFLLVFGVVLAAAGVAFWQYMLLHLGSASPIEIAVGIGVTVLGGGLVLGGIVRMVLKR